MNRFIIWAIYVAYLPFNFFQLHCTEVSCCFPSWPAINSCSLSPPSSHLILSIFCICKALPSFQRNFAPAVLFIFSPIICEVCSSPSPSPLAGWKRPPVICYRSRCQQMTGLWQEPWISNARFPFNPSCSLVPAMPQTSPSQSICRHQFYPCFHSLYFLS